MKLINKETGIGIVIGILFTIASGVWVAIALVSPISSKHRAAASAQYQGDEKNST